MNSTGSFGHLQPDDITGIQALYGARPLPPTIDTQPTPQTAAIGGTATFTVVASGSPAPTYQWKKNGITINGATNSTLTLTNVQSSTAGNYSVTVSNPSNSVTSNAVALTVTGAVTIDTPPSSQAVAVGGTATFTVAASSTPAPNSWQWKKDGSAIGGATTSTLSLTNVQPSAAGNYSVTVGNGLDSVTSASAALTVNQAPTITAQPTPQTTGVDDSASFSASASGTPTPTYQWQKNGNPIGGATSATLTLTNVQASDAGNYRLVATNALGSATSSAAALTVTTYAPTITGNPASQTVGINTTAVFTAAATGAPRPTYQWQKNGVAIPGATLLTLTLGNVQPDAAGDYRMVATNSDGSATSQAATLTVSTILPTITTHPLPATVNSGAQVTFTAAATGAPVPTYQWQKDGVAIPGATQATLTLSNVQAIDAGQYRMIATNAGGSAASNSATLTVNFAPVISTQPTPQTANEGTTATFTAAASGVPAPTYQWQKDGVTITGATSATLTLTNVTPDAFGNYRVIATNALGSATSQAAPLTVNFTPIITTQPTALSLTTGSNGTLFVQAGGVPAPTYQWRRNGVALPGATAFALALRNVQAADAGTYTVVVSNSVGSVTSAQATVTVNATPTITTQPISQTIGVGSTATFTVIATGTPTPTYQWKKGDSNIPGATSASLSLPRVQTGAAGEYKVVVTNDVGTVTSNTVTLTIGNGPAITTQPADVAALVGASVSFTVEASGIPAPTYQWYRNGLVVAGQTAATFTPFTATSAQSGSTFYCVVSNSAGTSTSRTATLTVASPAAPVITAQPADVIGEIGTQAGFTVAATGTPAPTYQWRINGAIQAGQTAATFPAFAIQGYHQGWTFDCVITNASGSVTSRAATITVGSPTAPAITTQPADVVGAVGTQASFTVVATGIPAPTYQWSMNGQVVAGQTAATFAPFTIQSSHNGATFSCTVTNASGSVASRSATLQLPGAPTITTQPADMAGELGTDASFTVVATGVPAPTYQWSINGQPAAGQTAATFPTFKIQGYHNGWTFSCAVTNSAGSVTTRLATLTVGAVLPPAITTQPQPLGVVVGQPGSVAVTVTGATGYQWFKGGVAVTGATGASLAFPALGSADAGIYDCAVTGLGGETLSSPVVVGVVPAAGQRTAGAVSTYMLDIHHPNGAVYDQFLLTGSSGTFTAGTAKIARCSYLDENGSIVQVEMSGAGAITIALVGASGPKAPALYNQSGIEYMQGKATVILSGADATTHFTIYSVGTFTNPGVTRPEVNYAGWANVAAAGIISPTGGLGGIHQGNVGYNASTGLTGLYAPTVTSVGGLVVVHGIQASGTAQPYLFFGTGGTADIKIAGTSLAQPNTDDITVRGLSRVTMGAGQDSCGRAAPALAIQGSLVNEAGTNVTAALVGP